MDVSDRVTPQKHHATGCGPWGVLYIGTVPPCSNRCRSAWHMKVRINEPLPPCASRSRTYFHDGGRIRSETFRFARRAGQDEN